MNSSPPDISVSQAAEYLGVCIPTLRRWSNAGKVSTYRTLGGQRRYKADDLARLRKRMLEKGPT